MVEEDSITLSTVNNVNYFISDFFEFNHFYTYILVMKLFNVRDFCIDCDTYSRPSSQLQYSEATPKNACRFLINASLKTDASN
jgi:hypothetical protein